MHKTTIDRTAGDKSMGFPTLPGLVIKGQGESLMPLSDRDKKLGQHATSAYALSPKLVKQLKIDDKLKEKEKEKQKQDDVASTKGMTINEI